MQRLILMLLGLLCASLAWAQPDKSAMKVLPINSHALEDALIHTVENGAIPGVICSVDGGGTQVWGGAIGFAEVQTERPIRSTDPSRIGGVTMLLTATLTLSFAQDGILRLDDKLQTWLPKEIADSLPNYRDLTIRQCLNHTSGVFDYLSDAALWSRVENDPFRRWTSAEVIRYAFATRHPATQKAGEKYSFSHSNYLLLGMVIEKAAGKPFHKVLRSRILEPLGMDHTSVELYEPYNTDKLVHGYADADTNGLYEDYIDVNQVNGLPDCGLISTADDLVKFIRALFLEKRLLTQEYLDQMLTGVPADDGGRYGLGVNIVDTPWGSMLGHSGGLFGYNAGVFCLPKYKLCVSFLLNGSGGASEADFDRLLGKVLEIVLNQ